MKNFLTVPVLPITISLAETDLQQKQVALDAISLTGNDFWGGGGDQWHGTGYREQQRQKDLAEVYRNEAEKLLKSLVVMDRPIQDIRVQLGHSVQVRFLDDDDLLEAGIISTVVHLMSSPDRILLGSRFDNMREMIVSTETSIGKGLLMKERGDITTYGRGMRAEILDFHNSICVSYLFDTKE